MDPVSAEPQSDDFVSFCKRLSSTHSANWPPHEDVLARELMGFLPTGYPLTFERARELCIRWGIGVVVRPIPLELRGFNGSVGNRHMIVVSKYQTYREADVHTLLHELREILEHVFQELGMPTAGNREDLEKRAELFAGMVRVGAYMPVLSSMFEGAGGIQSKFWRYGAYALIAVLGFIVSADAVLLPHFEDYSLARNLRT